MTAPIAPTERSGDGWRRPGDHPAWGAARAGQIRHAAGNYLGVGGVLVALCILLTVTQERFLTWANFLNIAEANADLLIVAVGMTMVLLVGGFDLSLGGLMALVGIALWELLDAGVPSWGAVALVILGAGLLGTVLNGFLIGKVGLSFLVVTLATGSIFRGLAQVRSGGQSQSMYQYQFLLDIGSGEWAGVPIPVLIAGAALLVGIVLLRYTGFGRMIYATGGNREAARLAGINVTGVSVAVFGIAALLAGIAAVMNTGRLTSASPTASLGIELTAGAAVLLGGTRFTGGRGSLLGTLMGVAFLGVLSNGLTLAGINPFWQPVVLGVVLIAALLVDRIRAGAPEAP